LGASSQLLDGHKDGGQYTNRAAVSASIDCPDHEQVCAIELLKSQSRMEKAQIEHNSASEKDAKMSIGIKFLDRNSYAV
jgi:hypothetical protein